MYPIPLVAGAFSMSSLQPERNLRRLPEDSLRKRRKKELDPLHSIEFALLPTREESIDRELRHAGQLG